jgi:hypothetical protein
MPENLEDIESLARPYTGAAIKTLAEIMMNPSASARARRAAAAVLARRSRAWLRYDHAAKSKTWHPK